jgi:hypothetical protein
MVFAIIHTASQSSVQGIQGQVLWFEAMQYVTLGKEGEGKEGVMMYLLNCFILAA